jgi:hypothetical protein
MSKNHSKICMKFGNVGKMSIESADAKHTIVLSKISRGYVRFLMNLKQLKVDLISSLSD